MRTKNTDATFERLWQTGRPLEPREIAASDALFRRVLAELSGATPDMDADSGLLLECALAGLALTTLAEAMDSGSAIHGSCDHVIMVPADFARHSVCVATSNGRVLIALAEEIETHA